MKMSLLTRQGELSRYAGKTNTPNEVRINDELRTLRGILRKITEEEELDEQAHNRRQTSR
jgi:hypothetical protein